MRLTVSNITCPEVSITGLGGNIDAFDPQCIAQGAKELVKCGAITHSHVVDLIFCFVRAAGRQQICLHCIGYKAEIAASFAVTVDEYSFAFKQCIGPFGDDGGIGAVGILTGAKNIEVAKAHSLEVVAPGKHSGVQLVHVFGHRIGTERVANVLFHLG